MAHKNYPKTTTPRGTAIYPRLNTPDDKFNKAGQYKVKLAIDADDPRLAKLREQVIALRDEKFEEIKSELIESGKKAVAAKVQVADPFNVEEDEETGEETGRVLINAKMTASGVGKKGPWSRKPTIFDAKGKAIKNPPMIGSGSTLILSVELFPYYAANDKTVGVSFRLEAAQVIKLVSGGSRDAAGYGFASHDDGDELNEMEDDGPPFNAVGDDEDDDL